MPEQPDIHTFLENGGWQDRFDDDHLQLAARLRSKVRQLRGEWVERDNFTLHASVAGESCSVTLWPSSAEWDFESECTCPARSFCPHAAALLGEASKPQHLGRLLTGDTIRGAGILPAAKSIPASSPSEAPVIAPTPTFHLRILREPTDSKIIRLLLQALKLADTGDWVLARPLADYDGHRIPLDRPSGGTFTTTGPDGRPLTIQRDFPRELTAVTTLQQIGLRSLAEDPRFRFLLALGEKQNPQSATRNPQSNIWFPDPAQFPAAEYWPWLRTRGATLLGEAGWSVAFAGDVGHEVIEIDPDHIRYQIDPGNDWFHLSVGFEVAGRTLDLLPILARLLDQGLPGESPDGHILHLLDDGRTLRLPLDRLRTILNHFAALLDPRRFAGGKLRLHPLDAAALGTNADLGIDPPPELAALAASIRDFEGIAAEPIPAGLRAKLRLYQLGGFRWMQFLARHQLHGILADDMGLGKTIQTLAHLLAEKDCGRSAGRPSLVVAPTSVVPNWMAEAARFAPSLRVLVLDGPQRRRDFPSIPHADLVVTSYALLQRDADDLRQFQYHVAVLDEAQNIKNPRAKVAAAACQLDARHRLCLSGTPVENHLGELWSLMRFLMPGFLGGESDFRKRFRIPIEKDDDESRRNALKSRLAPLILRRTKDQVASELPPKIELVHSIELNTGQKDLYETIRATMDKRVRAAIAASGLEGSRMVFLEALLKLRQICCDPRLLKLPDHDSGSTSFQHAPAGILPEDSSSTPPHGGTAPPSAKLDELADLLDTLVEEGRRILLFSQFTSMLALIEELLKKRRIPYLILTGSSKNRGELVARFQSGAVPVFLISLKAGGTGLNLTAADTVIHYDPWWNPAAQAQATDRAHRIGQQQTVFVHKLLCRGTVEERIHLLQQKKSSLAEALLADSARAAAPDPETLAALLAPLE